MFLKADHIYLRAIERADLEILYSCENDLSVWKVSNTQTPFSKHVLEQYLVCSHQDIYTNKQLRLMICLNKCGTCIGTVDIFEFEPTHGRAGVGVLIFEEYRNKGYAREALTCLIDYAFSVLMLHQLYCNIGASNTESLQLFEKLNFKNSGLKKQWNKIAYNEFEDELFYQLVK